MLVFFQVLDGFFGEFQALVEGLDAFVGFGGVGVFGFGVTVAALFLLLLLQASVVGGAEMDLWGLVLALFSQAAVVYACVMAGSF